ncbi:MAG: InlB B-repeat-containing protein, partial [Clostridia bacterium]
YVENGNVTVTINGETTTKEYSQLEEGFDVTVPEGEKATVSFQVTVTCEELDDKTKITNTAYVNEQPTETTETTILYAYTVKYYKDGETEPFDTSKDLSAEFGSKIEKENIDLSNKPNEYKLEKIETVPFTITSNPDNNVIKVYYVKEKIKYTVTYLPGEYGTGEMSPITNIEPGTEITVSECEFIPNSGYVFAGWSGSDGKPYAPGDTITVNSNITLTAKWNTFEEAEESISRVKWNNRLKKWSDNRDYFYPVAINGDIHNQYFFVLTEALLAKIKEETNNEEIKEKDVYLKFSKNTQIKEVRRLSDNADITNDIKLVLNEKYLFKTADVGDIIVTVKKYEAATTTSMMTSMSVFSTAIQKVEDEEINSENIQTVIEKIEDNDNINSEQQENVNNNAVANNETEVTEAPVNTENVTEPINSEENISTEEIEKILGEPVNKTEQQNKETEEPNAKENVTETTQVEETTVETTETDNLEEVETTKTEE